tara:strand:+ start:477 stop:818 length:342 start_codon:yes stop_codon:yes gene_type:complete
MTSIELTDDEAAFVEAYFEAVNFTMKAEGMEPDQAFKRESIIDCLAFYSKFQLYERLIPTESLEDVAHNFWYSRNGRGVGFWDGAEDYLYPLPEWLCQKMQSYSEAVGEAYPF